MRWWLRADAPGWREFRAMLRVLNERRNPAPSVDRWDETARANFDELDALRRKRRGF